ncbi:MAG: hypothetical protein ABIX01_19905 [Chitinophagaceae bacterium]
MEKIIYTPRAKKKIEQLFTALLKKGYFFEVENALDYIANIDKAISNISDATHHKTKNPYFGKWYIKYKANRKTTWYIFFDKDNEGYLIKNIINNHTNDNPRYIASFI